MPFVNPSLSPEQRTHLSDQWHAANAEFDRIKTPGGQVTPQEQEIIDHMVDLQRQLRGLPPKEK